jgi:multidrug efflux pump subunit AcrA (membrane-fusion protein)
MTSRFKGIFRSEAIEHHRSMADHKGDVLRLSPGWIRWMYPVTLVALAAGLVWLGVGRIQVYGRGPAVIRVAGRYAVTSPVAAVVESILVTPGQRVRAGELLVQFESAEKVADVERVTRDFEDQLANHLRDPLDDASRRSVASLRAEKEYAEHLLETRRLRAPKDGIVEDLRVRAGQPLTPGQIAATIQGSEPSLRFVAALPGQYRPQLRLGLPAWLELQGYANSYHKVVLGNISSEVIGPAEARRVLGAEVADAVAMGGPVVLVEGRLPRSVFRSEGATYSFHDGMQARLEVRLKSEPILYTLLPGMRYFAEHHRD